MYQMSYKIGLLVYINCQIGFSFFSSFDNKIESNRIFARKETGQGGVQNILAYIFQYFFS